MKPGITRSISLFILALGISVLTACNGGSNRSDNNGTDNNGVTGTGAGTTGHTSSGGTTSKDQGQSTAGVPNSDSAGQTGTTGTQWPQ
jgi:hypothetical protein